VMWLAETLTDPANKSNFREMCEGGLAMAKNELIATHPFI